MIEIKNVSKTFENHVEAVRDVSITIPDGQIFGIIGYSGAGKSTLVRLINRLEEADKGSILIDGVDILKLNSNELRKQRQKIGMIFQRFNLFRARTVYENVAFPLENTGKSKAEIKDKVLQLLELVGLSDKKNSYPSQLSGGQMQRVGIARALANDPKVLLCDEATSALDPQTTQSILKLLKDVNKQLGITLILITHQMSVIKDICDEVAIMDKGQVVEKGTVKEIFYQPKEEITRQFIQSANNSEKFEEYLTSDQFSLAEDEVLAELIYGENTTGEALISNLIKNYNVVVNILYGNIEIISGSPMGNLVITLKGDRDNINEGISFLKEHGIRVEVKENV